MAGDECYELEKGQGFLIEPEVQTFYQADEEEPWTYMWVAFDGTRVKEYLSGIGLGQGKITFCCEHISDIKVMLLILWKKYVFC